MTGKRVRIIVSDNYIKMFFSKNIKFDQIMNSSFESTEECLQKKRTQKEFPKDEKKINEISIQ